jgi:drug/metabolite transporter (DMT)-like permease
MSTESVTSQDNRAIGKDRSPGAILGLSIITLGIYFLVWHGKLNAEIERHAPDIKVSPGLAVLAMMLPISNMVSAYGTAARIRQMQKDCGDGDTISPVVALLLFIFLGIGYPLYVGSQVREHWHGHSRANRLEAETKAELNPA